jgi:adenine-specific DNA methylase
VCGSAESLGRHIDGRIDVCVFDPPYFDYIHYSELSEFHRAWFPEMMLGGASLFPEEGNGVQSFGNRLGCTLRAIVAACSGSTPLVFTFHSVDPQAWESLALALDRAELAITGLWPVRSDGHMGHHSHEGNCEWDLIFACRPQSQPIRTAAAPHVEDLLSSVAPLRVRAADRDSMRMACDMVYDRFRRLEEHPNEDS